MHMLFLSAVVNSPVSKANLYCRYSRDQRLVRRFCFTGRLETTYTHIHGPPVAERSGNGECHLSVSFPAMPLDIEVF
jgi:hypothetical protein